jgi:hypothetical protein
MMRRAEFERLIGAANICENVEDALERAATARQELESAAQTA